MLQKLDERVYAPLEIGNLNLNLLTAVGAVTPFSAIELHYIVDQLVNLLYRLLFVQCQADSLASGAPLTHYSVTESDIAATRRTTKMPARRRVSTEMVNESPCHKVERLDALRDAFGLSTCYKLLNCLLDQQSDVVDLVVMGAIGPVQEAERLFNIGLFFHFQNRELCGFWSQV